MSRTAIRAGLETALNTISPALATAWQNTAFTPTPGTPYQKAELVFVRPVNNETGGNWRQDGYMQVTLRYPGGTGPAAAGARADLIVASLKRGNSYVAGGITTTISDVPEEMPGFQDGDRWAVPVRVPFYAHVYTG